MGDRKLVASSHEKTGYVSTAEASPRDGEAVRVHDAWLLTTQCWQRKREKGEPSHGWRDQEKCMCVVSHVKEAMHKHDVEKNICESITHCIAL